MLNLVEFELCDQNWTKFDLKFGKIQSFGPIFSHFLAILMTIFNKFHQIGPF